MFASTKLNICPEFDSLINKKIAMLWNDINGEGSRESVLRWYYGTVECIKDKRGRGDNKSCVAAIKWEVGGDVMPARATRLRGVA